MTAIYERRKQKVDIHAMLLLIASLAFAWCPLTTGTKFSDYGFITVYTKAKEITNSEKTKDTVQIHLFLSE